MNFVGLNFGIVVKWIRCERWKCKEIARPSIPLPIAPQSTQKSRFDFPSPRSCSSVLQGPSGCLETPSALILRATLVKSDRRPKLLPQLKQPLLPQPLLLQHKLPPLRQPPPPPQQQLPQRRQRKVQRTQALRSVPGLHNDRLHDTMSGQTSTTMAGADHLFTLKSGGDRKKYLSLISIPF